MTEDADFELEQAITRNELELHYQPIFEIDGKRIRGVEALVRWRHPRRGLIAPGEFLLTVERHRLMHELTAWVLREALLQASVWRKDGAGMNVSVNIAASDLRDARFVRLLDRTLRVTAAGSGFTAELRAEEAAGASGSGLRDLVSRGIPIALDDVTSVTQLDGAQAWPIDTVKLGREVTAHALDDPRAADSARAIARFAAERGIALVAVGVENQAMLSFAQGLGCVGAQGYGLAKPMRAEALRRWAHGRV